MADPTHHPTAPPSTPSPSALSLQTYVSIIRRQRWMIILVALLGMGIGMLPALLREPAYASTASVRVAALDREGVFSGQANTSNITTERLIDLLTEVEILGSEPTRAAVLSRLPEPASEFDGPFVDVVPLTEIIEITVTADEPPVAAEVANLYAEIFIEDRRTRSIEDLVTKADELRDQSAAASRELDAIAQRLLDEDVSANEMASLQLQQSGLVAQVQDYNRRADQFGVEAALRGRGTHLIAPAEPNASSITEGPARGAVLGLTLGLLLGLALAVVVDTVQDKVGSRDDLAALRPGAPVLTAVPHTDFDRARPPGPATQEAYRYLRTGVRIFGLNAELRSVLVTSAVGNEGKTTTAEFLARTMAEAGDRVVVIDCDLRRPSLHEGFALSNEAGLSTMVLGDVSLDSVTHFVDSNLAVVPAGPAVQNPTDVLGSERFASVVASLRDQADFVILDSPPVLPVADALIAGQLADGAIVVGRVGGVRRRAVRELLHRLDEAGIPLVGFVANDTERSGTYDYYSAEADRIPPAGARVGAAES